MSAVEASMTREQAERLSTRISLRLDTVADNWTGALALIREAIDGEAFRILGYASHGAYISDRFGNALSKLGVELRREVVRELSDAGLSTRAIAPVVGVSQKTVVKDTQVIPPVSPDEEVPPTLSDTPGPITKLTGTNSASDSYWSPEESFVGAHPITGEVIDAPTTVTETHTIKTVTGLDGKAYPKAAPKPKPEPKPVATGDAANRQNAEAESINIGRALSTFLGFTYETYRTRILTDWWPLGKDSVPPANRDLFNPSQLRQIAQGINQLADELEALK